MRRLLITSLLALVALTSSAALADVGPRAPCPSGTRHQYLYGHHCVPEGSHLEQDPNGGVVTVKDGTTLAPRPTAAPSATASAPASAAPDAPPPVLASPPASTSATPASTPQETTVQPSTPPSQRGCACELGDIHSAGMGAAFAVVAGLALLGLRRRGQL